MGTLRLQTPYRAPINITHYDDLSARWSCTIGAWFTAAGPKALGAYPSHSLPSSVGTYSIGLINHEILFWRRLL